jgi:N-sulfoglucosamine sulfohydrolase
VNGQPLNLLIITADDLNADSAGWMGSRAGATPNIDKFAVTATQFRNCHTVIPICQPSRSAFMTGRYPHRNGASGFGPVSSNVPTLTEILRANGYFTAAINKIKHMAPPEKFPWDVALDGSGKNPKELRAHFEQCLNAARKSGKPFFINANSTDPHGPFGDEIPYDEAKIDIPPFLEDLPEVRREIAQYFSNVQRLDQSVGEILDALGKGDDTIVLFFSDHGMPMPFSKAVLYRYATWTPVLLRGAKIDNSDDLLANIDLMPTVLDLLGLTKPDGMDGRSWLEAQPRDHIFTQVDTVNSGREFHARCVRSKSRAYIWNPWADGKTEFRIGAMANRASWKVIVAAAARDPKIKARVEHFIHRCPQEFYDEEHDPNERVNLITDPAYKIDIDHFKELLADHMEKSGDPLLEKFRRLR